MFLALFTLSNASAQINERYNKITITNWIKPANGINLNNKFIVLNFYRSSDEASSAAVVHLNDLQQQFDDNVVFVCISDEHPEKLKEKLLLFSSKLLLSTDVTGDTQRFFFIENLPATVILNNKGIVKWRGQTKDLTFPIINNALIDKSFDDETFIKKRLASTDSLYQSYRSAFDNPSITSYFKSTSPSYSFRYASVSQTSNYKALQIGAKLSELLSRLLYCTTSEILLPQNLNNMSIDYCFKQTAVKSMREGDSTLLNSILKKLNLIIVPTETVKDLYIIKVVDSLMLSRARVSSVKQNAPGKLISKDSIIKATNYSLNTLATNLSNLLGYQFKYETNLIDNSNYDMILSIKTLPGLRKSLNSYGLELTTEKKAVMAYNFR